MNYGLQPAQGRPACHQGSDFLDEVRGMRTAKMAAEDFPTGGSLSKLFIQADAPRRESRGAPAFLLSSYRFVQFVFTPSFPKAAAGESQKSRRRAGR